jgi:cobalamin biosynthesis Mg chelatase CobN
MFDDKYYTDLDGGILEAFGRMFKNDLKLYIYPVSEDGQDRLATAETLDVAPHLRHLYAHLLRNGHIVDIRRYRREYQRIHARTVLACIRSGDSQWEAMVPAPVVRMVKERKLFEWRG